MRRESDPGPEKPTARQFPASGESRHRRPLLTFGSLSDRFGRKGMLLAGLAVVGTASLAGAFTTSAAQLIGARAVVGLGAAMTFPATLSLISNVFTGRRQRARATFCSWTAQFTASHVSPSSGPFTVPGT